MIHAGLGFWELLRGDLRLFLRDHVAILLAVVLPIASIPLMLGGMGGATEAGQANLDTRPLQVQAPPELDEWLQPEDYLERTDLPFLDHPEDDTPSAHAELKAPGSHTPAVIRYRGNDTDSREAKDRLIDVLEREQDRRQALKWTQHGIEFSPDELLKVSERDLSTSTARAGHAAGKWLPMMLFILVCTGGFYTALDLFAGERERGTLETLLVSRLSRSTILAARFVLVLGFCLATACLALGSLWFGVSQGWIQMSATGPQESALPLSLLAETVLLCIPLAGLLGALLIATATLAPDLKTGQALAMPVLLVVSALGGVTVLPGIELSPVLCMVPLSGLALGIQKSLVNELSAGELWMVFGATTIHAAIALSIAHRLLQRESILFMSTTSHRRKKGRLGLEAALTYGLAMVLFWFLGQLAMNQDLIAGMLFTQLMVLGGTALAVIIWLGLPVREVLQLRRPRLSDLALAALLGVCAPCLSWLFMDLQSHWIPVNDVTTGMLEAEIDLSLVQALLVFALLPGICEELLFRGTIQGLLRGSTQGWARCIIVGILFGSLHLSVGRVFPTGMVGILLCIAALRSRSIFVPMLVHTLHNGLLITYAVWVEKAEPESIAQAPGYEFLLPGAAVSLACLGLMGRGREP